MDRERESMEDRLALCLQHHNHVDYHYDDDDYTHSKRTNRSKPVCFFGKTNSTLGQIVDYPTVSIYIENNSEDYNCCCPPPFAG